MSDETKAAENLKSLPCPAQLGRSDMLSAAGLKRLAGEIPHRWRHLMRFERA